MTLTPAQVLDLATGTLAKFDRARFRQIAQRLQSYEVMNNMLKRSGFVDRTHDGTSIVKFLQIAENGSAKMTGLYGKDSTIQTDVAGKIDVPWRRTQAQANRAVDQWSQQMRELPQQVSAAVSGATRQLERAADSAAGAISAATGWLAAAYVVGLLAAIGGGLLGKPKTRHLDEEVAAVYPHGAHPAH